MSIPRPAVTRFRAEAIPLALAALLLASLPVAAQQRSRPSDSSDTGRSAHETGSHSSAPSSHSTPSSPRSSDSSSSASGDHSPRTAHRVPQTPSADRQPSHDRGGRGSHGGHFHNGGFYYPPFWDNYYYPYYWGRAGWGWGLWWGPDYDPYYYPRGGYYDRDEMGALDLDVSPGRTEVYVDGQRLGTVDDYDGWPRYLWLPRGTYDVVFYLDGFQTIARQITVYPGSVLDIDDRLEPGASKRPEELATKTHERRDERIGYDRELRRRVEEGEDEDWRDRARRDRGSRRYDRDDDRDHDVAEEHDDYAPRGGDKGRLVLDVEPEDSSVYVDGRFVGTGSDLSNMRSGLPLAPGEHKLAVVRPGRKSEEQDFTVKAGESTELDVTLEESGPGR